MIFIPAYMFNFFKWICREWMSSMRSHGTALMAFMRFAIKKGGDII